jgi:predicted dehydrogenase
MHWPSLYQLPDRYEVTALCDVSPLVLEQLGKHWNVENLTTDHRELVTHSDVDAVLVASPNAFHAEVTLDAIAAGKHVLVEKPMCITRREADNHCCPGAAMSWCRSAICAAMHRRFWMVARRSGK